MKTLITFFVIGIALIALSTQISIAWLSVALLVMGILVSLFSIRFVPIPDDDSYESKATRLFKEIQQDIQTIHNIKGKILDQNLRDQLTVICEDVTVLMEKVREKKPESQLTTGTFIRGNLDFILSDILPQYIEMQETPRYYDTPNVKMTKGEEAIGSFSRFIHQRIVELEIADDLRYAVAIEMLKALDTYTNEHVHNNEVLDKEGTQK